MKKFNNLLIILISVVSLIFMGYFIYNNIYDRVIASASMLLVLCFPKIIGNIFRLKISPKGELIYIIFIFLVQFLGSVLSFYDMFWWYDVLAHFASGILTSILGIEVLNWFKVYKRENMWFNVLFIICFSLMASSLWEFVEFGADIILKMDVQHHLTTGVFDTMEDMLVAFLGSIIVGIWYIIKLKTKKPC